MPTGFYGALAKAKTLNKRNAPALLACVEELAHKAGTFAPQVLLLPTEVVNAAFHPASGTLWVTEGLLHAFESSNMHRPPSKPLRAILAHEMGHVKFRWSQMGTMMGLVVGIPMAGMGALYLIEKTNQRLKQKKKLDPDHPEAFWDSFKDVTGEMQQQGPLKTYQDFWKYSSPSLAKSNSADPKYKHMSWSDAGLHEAKMLAVQAAMLVPALAACRPVALANERQSDRFAVALTGNREDFLTALQKLAKIAEEQVTKKATTPLQKTWAQRIRITIQRFLNNTVMAHPDLAERIQTVSKMNPETVARSFGL